MSDPLRQQGEVFVAAPAQSGQLGRILDTEQGDAGGGGDVERVAHRHGGRADSIWLMVRGETPAAAASSVAVQFFAARASRTCCPNTSGIGSRRMEGDSLTTNVNTLLLDIH